MGVLEVGPGSCNEPSVAPLLDMHGVSDIKVEEDNPLPLTFPAIKDEHEVGCMALYPLLDTFADIHNSLFSSSSSSVSLST